jgi:uncharacterized membrane protein YfcA
LIAGIFSGAFGIGGATIIIPALVFLLSFNQHQAQGTALAALLLPVGLLAALKYYYNGNIVIDVALYTAVGFLFGGFIGASIVQPIPDIILRRSFAVYLIVIAVSMLF